jgi:hypothetical protein
MNSRRILERPLQPMRRRAFGFRLRFDILQRLLNVL